ncbi:MAG TPA: galactokinase [Chitinophagaceae bacterium]|nr:galactokinase [Chitinophagaceae bacterium]
MKLNADSMAERFIGLFGNAADPMVVRSPGRVNLIGEHTDYNDGFVLPAAINKAAWVAVTSRNDNQVLLFAEDYHAHYNTTLDSLAPTDEHWPNYILGVADQLRKSGIVISGFNLLLAGDIPIGAGLSSSAAVECATLFALNILFDLHLSKAEMAHIAQHAEHDFAGVKCGVMDMFTSLFGKKDEVINLDCRSLFYEYVPLDLKGYKLLLLNTNLNHRLSSSDYNTRRQQCEQGVAWVKEKVPSVEALRDVTSDMLERYVKERDPLIYQRCLYVVEENHRLQQACRDLKKGDIRSLGKRMFETHEGLSKQYEVSCPELDFLVDAVKGNADVLGARMMGGGFGGCTINIVKAEAIKNLVSTLRPGYERSTGLSLGDYIVSVENGTELMRKRETVHA